MSGTVSLRSSWAVPLLLSVALLFAPGVRAQAGLCKSGQICMPAATWTSSPSTSFAHSCWKNDTSAVMAIRNAQWWYLASNNSPASCSAAPSAYPIAVNTTANFLQLGLDHELYFDGSGTAQGLPVPTYSVVGITSDQASKRLWRSDTAKWVDLGGGKHPALEKQTYVFGWKAAAPGFESGANPPTAGFSEVTPPTETCAGGSVTNVANFPLGGSRLGLGRKFQTSAILNATCNDASVAWLKWTSAEPRQCFRVWTDSAAVTTTRFVAGFGVSSLFTAATDAPATQGAWIRYSTSAGDTNWMGCVSGGAAATCTSLGVAVAANTAYEVCIDGFEANAVAFYVDGQTRQRVLSNVPTSTDLSFGSSITTLAASARSFTIGKRTFEVSQ